MTCQKFKFKMFEIFKNSFEKNYLHAAYGISYFAFAFGLGSIKWTKVGTFQCEFFCRVTLGLVIPLVQIDFVFWKTANVTCFSTFESFMETLFQKSIIFFEISPKTNQYLGTIILPKWFFVAFVGIESFILFCRKI